MRAPTECSISASRQDASNPFDSRNHSQVMGTGIDSRTGQFRTGLIGCLLKPVGTPFRRSLTLVRGFA